MERKWIKQQWELEDELEPPWDWEEENYTRCRQEPPRYGLFDRRFFDEFAQELGLTTQPHRVRHFR